MKKRLTLLFPILFVTLSAVEARQGACPEVEVQDRREAALQKILDDLIAANPDVPGVLLHVEAPQSCLSWSGAAGVDDRSRGNRLNPDQPFRVASNTKTYTAAAILRLVEEGKIDLSDPFAEHLPEALRRMLEDAGYDLPRMTMRHLLTHTSGLFDHTMSPDYVSSVLANPHKRWTRLEQIQFGVDRGKALGAPGEVYQYCDSGYVLLGGIVEEKTGKGMAAAFRELLGFDRLGLSSTWLETLEPKPRGVADRPHQYLGQLDTYDFDPSMDLYGGGGIVATSRDLALFQLHLFDGKVFKRKSTLDEMTSMLINRAQGGYRAGIRATVHRGMEGWGHSGFWNTFAIYFPAARIAIAGSVNQQQGPRGSTLVDPVLGVLADR